MTFHHQFGTILSMTPNEVSGEDAAVVGHEVVYDGKVGAYRIERTERRYEQGEWDDYGHATAELERLRSIERRASRARHIGGTGAP